MPVKASRVKKNIYKLLLPTLFIIALCVFAVFLRSEERRVGKECRL